MCQISRKSRNENAGSIVLEIETFHSTPKMNTTMKKFLYLALSMILLAACSSDEDAVLSANEALEPAQMVDVWIGMKDVGDGAICANVMRVPYNPIPVEEWPATLQELMSKHAFFGDASICRIETSKGVFYHTRSAVYNSLGGYFLTGEGLSLYYYDEEWKSHPRQEIPEGFPCIDGWECLFYDYSLGNHGPLWWRD